MKVNPYIAAAVAALVAGLTVLHAGLADGKLAPAEMLAAGVALLNAVGAALHIEPPRKDDAPAAATEVEPEVIVVPVDSHE